MPAPERRVFADGGALARGAAAEVARAAERALARGGRFRIALAGGSTPRALYRVLAADYAGRIAWDRTEIFFGDERCVPPTSPESNYRMAADALLDRLPPGSVRVHRMPGELPPEQGAEAYEALLRRVFPGGGAAPAFDLVLLGVGADGHTASLFPGSPALAERERWVRAVEAPAGISPRHRLTLTPPILGRAREVYFLVAGAEKRAAVRAALDPARAADPDLPAARIRGLERTLWLLDRAAA